MKKILSTLGIIMFIFFMFFTITHATSERPKDDAIKITTELLHNSIKLIDEN